MPLALVVSEARGKARLEIQDPCFRPHQIGLRLSL